MLDHSFDKSVSDKFNVNRDKYLLLRAQQVGVAQTSRETGWPEYFVKKACKGHDYCKQKPGRSHSIRPELPNSPDRPQITENITEIGSGFESVSDLGNLLQTCHVNQPEVLPTGFRKIPLTQGLFAIVDEDVFEEVSCYNWYAAVIIPNIYAQRKDDGRSGTISLHRHVLGLEYGDGEVIDHIDGNGLNNTRSNLRIVTQQQNQFNINKVGGKTSKFKGVSYHKQDRYWVTCIRIDKKPIRTYFRDELQAARHYDREAMKHFKEFAKTNFMLGLYSTEELATFTPEQLAEITPQ